MYSFYFIFSATGYSTEYIRNHQVLLYFLNFFFYLGFRGNEGRRGKFLKLENKTPYVQMIKYEPILNREIVFNIIYKIGNEKKSGELKGHSFGYIVMHHFNEYSHESAICAREVMLPKIPSDQLPNFTYPNYWNGQLQISTKRCFYTNPSIQSFFYRFLPAWKWPP